MPRVLRAHSHFPVTALIIGIGYSLRAVRLKSSKARFRGTSRGSCQANVMPPSIMVVALFAGTLFEELLFNLSSLLMVVLLPIGVHSALVLGSRYRRHSAGCLVGPSRWNDHYSVHAYRSPMVHMAAAPDSYFSTWMPGDRLLFQWGGAAQHVVEVLGTQGNGERLGPPAPWRKATVVRRY